MNEFAMVIVFALTTQPPLVSPEPYSSQMGCLVASMQQRPQLEAEWPDRSIARIACVPSERLAAWLQQFGQET